MVTRPRARTGSCSCRSRPPVGVGGGRADGGIVQESSAEAHRGGGSCEAAAGDGAGAETIGTAAGLSVVGPRGRTRRC